MRSLRTAFSHLSRSGKWLLGAGAFFIALAAVLSYRSYDYIQHDARFCQSCHIMDAAFEKWSQSPHHLVTCHECHKQPFSASLHQVWLYVTQRPDQVIHHPELDHKVCAQCHLSDDPQWKIVSETAGHKVHFEQMGIDCLDCHMGGLHEFLRPVNICVNCHADKAEGAGKKMAFVHCTDCHSFLSKKESLKPDRETCLECHSKIDLGHKTFPEGNCSECHKPHSSH